MPSSLVSEHKNQYDTFKRNFASDFSSAESAKNKQAGYLTADDSRARQVLQSATKTPASLKSITK